MRSRGAMGGGTLCRGEPQLLQRSFGVVSMRSQNPRASQSGLMHCTVHPGKYCTIPPLKRRSAPLSRRSSGWHSACISLWCQVKTHYI